MNEIDATWLRWARHQLPTMLLRMVAEPWFDGVDASVVSLSLLLAADVVLRRHGESHAAGLLERSGIDLDGFAAMLGRYHQAAQEDKLLRTIPTALQ